VDLPEVEEGDFGLEPIAAHSQFGDQVAGQEEVTGDGGAADAVEGLVTASVAHAGAAMARAAPNPRKAAASPASNGGWGDPLDPASGPTGWTGPIQSVASGEAVPTGWTAPIDTAGSGASGWTGPVDPSAAGWGESAAPAAPDGWSAPPGRGEDGPRSATEATWGVPEADQFRESSGQALALPTDAILGALQELSSDSAAAEMQWGDDASSDPAAPSEGADPEANDEPQAGGPDTPHEAEAPDAWALSDDPLAAESGPADPLVSPAGPEDPLGAEASADTPSWSEPSNELDPFVHRGHSTTQEFADPAIESDLAAAAAADAEESPDWRREQGAEESPLAQPDAFGQGTDAFTPLSEADLGTLASIGVEPSDGMGALRLLAALVRILNRGQHIEPDELRAEIHESLARGAMTAASSPPEGMESDVSPSGDEGLPAETAET